MKEFIPPLLGAMSTMVLVLSLSLNTWTVVDILDGQDEEVYGLLDYEPYPFSPLTGEPPALVEEDERVDYDCTNAVGNHCDTVKDAGAGAFAMMCIAIFLGALSVVIGLLTASGKIRTNVIVVVLFFCTSLFVMLACAAWAGVAHREIEDVYDEDEGSEGQYEVLYGNSWQTSAASMGAFFILTFLAWKLMGRTKVVPGIPQP
eukprot:Rmarinus@m.20063